MNKQLPIPSIILTIALIATTLFFDRDNAMGASVLFPYQGGTGKGTATAGDVGKYLKVSDDDPFTYIFDTPSAGGGGSDVNWTYFNNSGIRVSTSTNKVLIGKTSTSTNAQLEVVGGGYFDYATTTGIHITGISGSNQCLQADANGRISGTGAQCATFNNVDWTFFNGSGLKPELASVSVLVGGAATTTANRIFEVIGNSEFDDIWFNHATSSLGLYTPNLGINSEYFTDLTGAGLQNINGVLTLNATGDWTGTFDGQDGSYYLSRANHTGTQVASTVTGGTFGTGTFTFPSDLIVTGNATSTNFQATKLGVGSNYITNLVGTGLQIVANALQTTLGTVVDLTTEITGTLGVSNGGTGLTTYTPNQLLYGTPSGIIGQIATSSLGLLTTNVAEGSNLYWTQARFDTAFGLKTTDNLTEGSTNKYWSNNLWDIRMTSTTTLPKITTLANLTTVGTIGTGIWNGTAIGAQWGGTGSTTLSGILKGNGTGIVQTAIGGTDYEFPLTFSAPLSRSTNTISIPQGTSAADGFLDSADWTIFNNKISSTSLSGTSPINYVAATGVISLSTVLTSKGGTGNDWSTIAVGSIPYFNGVGTMTVLPGGSANNVLTYSGTAPQWSSSLNITSLTTGTLYVSNSVNQGNLLVSPGYIATGQTATTTIKGDNATSTFAGPISSLTGNFIIGSAGTTNNILLNLYGGMVGIGTSSPSNTFAVNGNGYFTNAMGIGINNTIANSLAVAGGGYFGAGIGVASTSPVTQLGVVGSGYFTAGLGVGVLNSVSGTLQTSGNATIGGILAVNGNSTSTFAAGIQGTYLNITGTNATSTFARGINLSGGCFAVSGTCVSGGGTPGGTDGQVQYNNGGMFGGGAGFIWDDINSILGVGTTTPFAQLSVHAPAGRPSLMIGSTTSTYLMIDSIGRVGIGTTTPTANFTVVGSVRGIPGRGHFSNLIASSTSATAVNITLDSAVLTDTNNNMIEHASINLTANITTSGLNGLDTGSEAASNWYYIWLVSNGSTVGSLLSRTATTTPTLPTGYTYKRLISAVRNNASSNFIDFKQTDDQYQYPLSKLIIDDGCRDASNVVQVDLSSVVPSKEISKGVFGRMAVNGSAETVFYGPTSFSFTGGSLVSDAPFSIVLGGDQYSMYWNIPGLIVEQKMYCQLTTNTIDLWVSGFTTRY